MYNNPEHKVKVEISHSDRSSQTRKKQDKPLMLSNGKVIINGKIIINKVTINKQ